MKLKKIKLRFHNRLISGSILLIIGIILGIAVTTIPLLANFTLPKLAFLASRFSQYTPQQVAKLKASPSAQIAVVSTPTPSPSVIPTTKPTSKQLSIQDRALRVAKFVYNQIRSGGEEPWKDFIKNHDLQPSNKDKEIADYANWLVQNPDTLKMNENKMNAMINGSVTTQGSQNNPDNSQLEQIKRDQEDLENKFNQYKSGQDYNCIMSGGVPSGGMCL